MNSLTWLIKYPLSVTFRILQLVFSKITAIVMPNWSLYLNICSILSLINLIDSSKIWLNSIKCHFCINKVHKLYLDRSARVKKGSKRQKVLDKARARWRSPKKESNRFAGKPYLLNRLSVGLKNSSRKSFDLQVCWECSARKKRSYDLFKSSKTIFDYYLYFHGAIFYNR